MLRSARRARLEARTTPMQRAVFVASDNLFLTPSFAGVTSKLLIQRVSFSVGLSEASVRACHDRGTGTPRLQPQRRHAPPDPAWFGGARPPRPPPGQALTSTEPPSSKCGSCSAGRSRTSYPLGEGRIWKPASLPGSWPPSRATWRRSRRCRFRRRSGRASRNRRRPPPRSRAETRRRSSSSPGSGQ
jgi:hypothetical protein